MVEHDIISPVGQLLLPGLDRAVQNLIHPVDIGSGGNHRRQILQGPLQGRIQPGGRQQIEEEQRNPDFPLNQQDRARQGYGGDAEFQD